MRPTITSKIVPVYPYLSNLVLGGFIPGSGVRVLYFLFCSVSGSSCKALGTRHRCNGDRCRETNTDFDGHGRARRSRSSYVARLDVAAH